MDGWCVKRIGDGLHEDPRVLPLRDVLPRVSASPLSFLSLCMTRSQMHFISVTKIRRIKSVLLLVNSMRTYDEQ